MDLDILYEMNPTSLVQAVRQGNVEAVKNILRGGLAHPNTPDHRGWTALHMAAACNQLEIVKILLEDERTNPDACNHNGDLALDTAVSNSSSLELVDCLARCTTLFQTEDYASPLLFEAARTASADIVKYLITNCPVDISDKMGSTSCSPVFIAMLRNDKDVLKLLLDACDDINDLYDYDGNYHKKTIVCAIEANCSLDIIKMLINKGATLNFDVTALMHAISNERIDVAFELLKHDVDVNQVHCGSTALTSAILIKERELVKEILSLVSFQVLESLCEKEGFNGVICCALSQYHKDILGMLLDSNFSEAILEAPTGIRFRRSRLFLMYEYVGPLALFLKERMDMHGNETLPIMQLLLSKGISIEPRKPSYMPPLVGALLSTSSSGNGPSTSLTSALKILLDSGVNVDHMTSVLPDALLIAVSQNNLKAFKMLLPYSQYTPCDMVRIGIEHNMDFLCTFILENMSVLDDYTELRSLCHNNADVSERYEELLSRFQPQVPSLTVIARRKVRKYFQRSKNSSEFLNFFEKLAIPETVKYYLRFLY